MIHFWRVINVNEFLLIACVLPAETRQQSTFEVIIFLLSRHFELLIKNYFVLSWRVNNSDDNLKPIAIFCK